MYHEFGNRCLVRKKKPYILKAIHLKYIITWMLKHTKTKRKEKKKKE